MLKLYFRIIKQPIYKVLYKCGQFQNIVETLVSVEHDYSQSQLYEQQLKKLQEIYKLKYEQESLDTIVRTQIIEPFQQNNIYQCYMILRLIQSDMKVKNHQSLMESYYNISSYLMDLINRFSETKSKTIIYGLCKQQIIQIETNKISLSEAIGFNKLFKLLSLYQSMDSQNSAPLLTLNQIMEQTERLTDEKQFQQLVLAIHSYLDKIDVKYSLMPSSFWQSLVKKTIDFKSFSKDKKTRRAMMNIINKILLTSLIKNLKITLIYEKLMEEELLDLKKRQFMNLDDLYQISYSTNTYQKVFSDEYPFISQIKEFVQNEQQQKILRREIELQEEIQQSNLKEILTFLKNNKIQINQDLIELIEQKCLNSLALRIDEEFSILNIQKINESLSLLLKDDRALQSMNPESIDKLHKLILKILQSPSIIDDNSLKKITVLVCKLWPNQIKMVSLAFKRIRSNIEGIGEFDKNKLSLCINSLFLMEKVQFNNQFLKQNILQNLTDSIQQNKDIVFKLNPQEISVLGYYIAKQVKKQGKKILLGYRKDIGDEDKYMQKIGLLLTQIIPQIQYLCNKNQLSLKVLYTIVDCFSKYKKYLVTEEIDLPYLFEKLEQNIMNAITEEIKNKRLVEEKDIRFLYSRFFFLRVGSRKFHRFLKATTLSYALKRDTNKISLTVKPTFYSAFKKYKKREEVYKRMQTRRRNSIFGKKN